MYSGINNIQKKLENNRDMQKVPFFTYEEQQAFRQQADIIAHIKQIVLYCSRMGCDKCIIRNILECDGHMKEIRQPDGTIKKVKSPSMCSSPADWMYHIKDYNQSEKQRNMKEV